ncbi:MAG: hypothetical protein RPU51_09185 [Candidatus Sedimenticola sp. (ex Thyasira tokunagai)]
MNYLFFFAAFFAGAFFFGLSGVCVSTDPAIFLISAWLRLPGFLNPFEAIEATLFEVFSFLAITDLHIS